MEQIKAHIDAAYAQLEGMVVGGNAKIPVGLAMAELTAAMADIITMEKDKSQTEAGRARLQASGKAAQATEKSEGKDAPA